MAFFWRRRATPDVDDPTADPAAVARVLEWLPGLNTPLTWETPPAEHADAHAAAGDEDDLCAIADPAVGYELPGRSLSLRIDAEHTDDGAGGYADGLESSVPSGCSGRTSAT